MSSPPNALPDAPLRRLPTWLRRLVACLALVATSALAAPRMALVLGNANYDFGPLPNVAKDAEALAERLRGFGFQVETATDLDQSQTYNTLLHFLAQAVDAQEVLFFYAGHAIQVNGRNYIVPLDAKVGGNELVFTLVDLRFLTERLDGLSARTKLIILDACRDNPFSHAANASGGLAEMNAPLGTLVAFSTAPGYTAEDGVGEHSPYMTALLQALDTPDASVEEVFKQVRGLVVKATGGRQIPWESTSLITSFRFGTPPVAPAPTGGGGKPTAPPTPSAGNPAENCPNCTCASLFTKLSLGLEGLTKHEQAFIQSVCR
ncbi:MAG: caspase family protein [Rhodocyclaceae bacterium]|nr:caspase family protein [Rhodocyclaceae bacterium]